MQSCNAVGVHVCCALPSSAGARQQLRGRQAMWTHWWGRRLPAPQALLTSFTSYLSLFPGVAAVRVCLLREGTVPAVHVGETRTGSVLAV
jgi:hypothetical protein